MTCRKLNVVGAKLRHLRMRKGLTQDQLAAKCSVLGWDVTAGTVAKIETHLRSVFDCELLVLSKALGITLPELFPQALSNTVLIECLNKPIRRPSKGD